MRKSKRASWEISEKHATRREMVKWHEKRPDVHAEKIRKSMLRGEKW